MFAMESVIVIKKKFVYPYIPNSVPEVKMEMLEEIGAWDAKELITIVSVDTERFKIAERLGLHDKRRRRRLR